MNTPDGITVVPTTYQDVVALLKSDALSVVEEAVALQCGSKIIYDYGSASTACTQAEISVCGMTTDQIQDYLVDNRRSVIEFGVRFVDDDEDEDPDGESETLGYGTGFGIKVAIYHNFLANRTPAEFRAFLKNRRIPKHTKVAKDLARLFAELQPK